MELLELRALLRFLLVTAFMLRDTSAAPEISSFHNKHYTKIALNYRAVQKKLASPPFAIS